MIVVPKERAVVSLWVNPWVQLNPLLLLIWTLTLGSNARTLAGSSIPPKRTGPGRVSGIIRIMNCSLPLPTAEDLNFCCTTGEPAPGAWWDCVLCLVAFRCPSANGIAQTASSTSRISALQRKCALIEGLRCFFMVLGLLDSRSCGSNLSQIAGAVLGGCTCGE